MTVRPRRSLPVLVHYSLRRTAMQFVYAEDLARDLVRDRQRRAAADSRVRRLVLARRWARRAEDADRRARAARAALR